LTKNIPMRLTKFAEAEVQWRSENVEMRIKQIFILHSPFSILHCPLSIENLCAESPV
jgi:hypothetical protein